MGLEDGKDLFMALNAQGDVKPNGRVYQTGNTTCCLGENPLEKVKLCWVS